MCSRTRRGGGYHEIAIVIVLAILLSLAFIMPAPGRAADVPAESFKNGALPPPIVTLLQAERQMLCRKSDTTTFHVDDIQLEEDRPQDDTETGIVLTQDEYRRLREGAAGLSPEEYKQFKKLISRQPATSLQVALVNSASIGTTILIAGFALIILLWVLRRMFNFWFDKDIYDDTWASVAVVVTLLLVTGAVIVAAVMR